MSAERECRVQVIQSGRFLDEKDEVPITNVVFMGMGEPLHNPDNVLQAVNILTDPQVSDLTDPADGPSDSQRSHRPRRWPLR